jgi:hypothetical protein
MFAFGVLRGDEDESTLRSLIRGWLPKLKRRDRSL